MDTAVVASGKIKETSDHTELRGLSTGGCNGVDPAVINAFKNRHEVIGIGD
jgi:hypothetical protein